jgi:hypothetical protein
MVQANPSSGVVQGIRQKLEMMPAAQLQQVAQTSSSEEVRAMALEVLREKQIREQAEAQAQQSIMQDQREAPQAQNMGISAAPAGSMDTLSAASGGIVAFANEGEVELDPEKEKRMRQDFLEAQQYTDFVRKQRESSGVGAPKAALAEFYAKQQADLGDERKRARGYDLMQFGVDLASQAGDLPFAVAKAGQRTLPGIISRQEGIKGRESDIAKGLAEIAEGERLMKAGDITAANAMFEKARGRESAEKIAGAKGSGNMMNYAQNYLAEKVAAGDKRDQNTILREGMDNYMATLGASGVRASTAATTAVVNTLDKARDNVDSSLSKNFNSPENKQLRKLQKEDKKNNTNTAGEYKNNLYRQEERRLQGGSGGGGGGGGGGRTPSLPSGFVPDKKS